MSNSLPRSGMAKSVSGFRRKSRSIAVMPIAFMVHIVERPGEPFLGTGEAAQGPTAAAIGNGLRDALGVRRYDLPFSRARLRATA